MKIRIILLVVAVFFVSFSSFSLAAKGDPPKPDPLVAIETVEDDLLIANDQIEDLNSRFSNRLIISGYSDVEYNYSSKSGEKHGFRLHHLSLFFQKTIGTKWRFFSELEYEDGPKFESDGSSIKVLSTTAEESDVRLFEDAEGKIFVEEVNISYLWNSKYNIRVGRFFTPAGIWSIDHFPPYIPTQERPLHIRKIFPQFVDGIVMFGTISTMKMFFNYDVFAGNGEKNSGHGDNNNNKAYGFRSSILLPYLRRFEIGVSAYSDVIADNTEKLAIGMHAKFKMSDVSIQSEVAWGELKDGGTSVSFGAYAQAYYEYLNWKFGFRYDYYTENRTQDTGQTILSLFANYHVNDSIVLKLESHENSFKDANVDGYRKAIASVIVYLGQ